MARSTWLWTILIGSLAFNAGFAATYGVQTYERHCRRDREGDRDRGPRSDRWRHPYESLNLTPEQSAEMEAIRDRTLEQVRQIFTQLNAEREALAALVLSDEPDREAIAQRTEAIAGLQRDAQQRLIERMLEERALMTPEQREGFNDLIRRRLGPREGHGFSKYRDGREAREGDRPERNGRGRKERDGRRNRDSDSGDGNP